MNNKTEYERKELHKTIWKIAEELRGSITGWDFKQYVLGFLFYRFISENLTNYINAGEYKAGNKDFDYAKLSDEDAEFARDDLVNDKGFFILPSELFKNVRKRANKDQDLNITLKNIFDNIENSAKGTQSEDDMKGLFLDLNTNDPKLGDTVAERNEKLVKILNKIGELNLGNYEDNTIDVFGDAYEFLMTMYASGAGKSGGEFFTPQEVGELLARITTIGKDTVNKVYDPCCGSGGLLLKFAKVLGKENVKEGFYGQERELTTYNLARINMFLHDINYNKFNIARGDTLLKPMHNDDEPFDAIVSNPPYSTPWEGKSNPLLINDERFSPAGVLAPESKADLAFTMHMLSYLSAKGSAAIVEFPGVLYRNGAEQKIRKYLIENNFVDTVIQLPSGLFFGTSIATCIIVLKKNKVTNDILFIDASDEFVTNPDKMKNGTNVNKLSDKNIKNIIEIIAERKNVDNKSVVIPFNQIEENNYNLTVSAYIEKEDIKETIDIKELNKNIKEIVERENVLRNEIDKIISEIEVDYE